MNKKVVDRKRQNINQTEYVMKYSSNKTFLQNNNYKYTCEVILFVYLFVYY